MKVEELTQLVLVCGKPNHYAVTLCFADCPPTRIVNTEGQGAIISIAGISDPNVFILMACAWMLVASGIRMRMLQSRDPEPKQKADIVNEPTR